MSSATCDDVEQHIAAVKALYVPLITGNADRLEHGGKLLAQFMDAVATYQKSGGAAVTAVIERVNELAVARIILSDPTLASAKVFYEPRIAADGRRIDFVVPEAEGGCLYIEVKTVQPAAKNSAEKWEQYQNRKKYHPARVTFHVEKDKEGAAIYGNAFSARSKFMKYTRDFEARLAEADKVQPGRGLLVFCLSGLQWHCSELEDFADFYLTGRHRTDDFFANMEADEIRKGNIKLKRNIIAFGFMQRPWDCVTEKKWIAALRGSFLQA